jgi:hypothetical protein
MANMPGTASSFKRKYCKNDFEGCARHQVFKVVGRENVPADLFPNQTGKVETIIRSV